MSKKMTDKEAEAIEKLKEISFMTGYKQALDLAIKALEVVGKIKKVCYSNENDFIDAVWDILCEAYGTEEDRESWLKKAENEDH